MMSLYIPVLPHTLKTQKITATHLLSIRNIPGPFLGWQTLYRS